MIRKPFLWIGLCYNHVMDEDYVTCAAMIKSGKAH